MAAINFTRTILCGVALFAMPIRGVAIAADASPGQSIASAVEWLEKNQLPTGHWDATEEGPHDIGVTGLSILALMQNAEDAGSRDVPKSVQQAAKYLVSQQDADSGCYGVPNSHSAFMYDHGIATCSLLSVYKAAPHEVLEASIKKGLAFIHASRNPYKAWRYAFPPDGNNDMSVTGWMVSALKEAKQAGFEVDPAALQGADLFVEEMTDKGTWRTGYVSRGGYSARNPGANEQWPESKTEAMTAVAVNCRLDVKANPSSEAVVGGIKRLADRLPDAFDPESIDFVYWYHASKAMARAGGDNAPLWHERLVDAATQLQERDGKERGSWPPSIDPWGNRAGRSYSTAICALALLEVGNTSAKSSSTSTRTPSPLDAPSRPKRGGSTSVGNETATLSPLLDVASPGEPIQFAGKIDAPRGSIDSLKVHLIFQGTVSRAVAIDLSALPGGLTDYPLFFTVTPTGLSVAASSQIPPSRQHSIHCEWEDDRGAIAVDASGSWKMTLAGSCRAGERAHRIGATATMVRSLDLRVASADQLRASARAAVALMKKVEVDVDSPRFVVTGDKNERVVTLQHQAGGSTTHYRVHLDLSGIPMRVETLAGTNNNWDLLFQDARSD